MPHFQTTCMAALTRHLGENRRLPPSKTSAVLTLFLDVHELQAQQLLHPSPLEVILRVILRQLTDQMPPSLDTMSEIQIENPAHLRELVRAAVQCFEQTYALIDDVHEILDLDKDDIFSELRSLNIQSIAFFGLPLNRVCGDYTTGDGYYTTGYCCDKCDKRSDLWAECETCKQCYCDDCYGKDQRCCFEYVLESSWLHSLTMSIA
jgi:hypothetical protein